MNAAPSTLLAVLLTISSATSQQTDWPSFHGEFARGVADGYPLPTTWDVESGENIKWKTAIPGMAHSSPVIAKGRIYLTTAVRDGVAELKVGLYGSIAPVEDEGAHQLQVLCLDAESGEVLWTRTAFEGEPAVKRHPKGSHAASTPATDGERVVAFFGSEGLHCYDRDGDLKWSVDFGVLDSGYFAMPKAQWGFASSPVIHKGTVYVQCDVQGDSFVTALDLDSGEEIWRTERDEFPTWSTPTVHDTPDRRQLILNGYHHLGGYNLDTGQELWRVSEKGGDIPVPTPVIAHGLVFITNAHGRMAPILAISTSAEGAFPIKAEASDHMAWSTPGGGNYMQTPVVYGDELYCCRDMGVLSCFDARTGERHYRQRIEGGVGFTASGVAGDGKLYFVSEPGDVHVLEAGVEFKRLAVNEMGEICMATPALSAGTLFVRGRSHLFAIAEQAK